MNSLMSISPVDGRYANKTKELNQYYSEYGLIKYRVKVEIQYLHFLKVLGLPQLNSLTAEHLNKLIDRSEAFSLEDAEQIKSIEATTNHDVKAVEYWVKERILELGLKDMVEFVHFGLTSQDINNTATPWLLKDSMAEVIYPALIHMLEQMDHLARMCSNTSMLARTHGQPASPTRLDKEISVFTQRIRDQLPLLYAIPFRAKFGGATGNFNAHVAAYPSYDWHAEGTRFVEEYLGLSRTQPTTQIEPYDMLAAHAHGFIRLNNILIDFCRDIWTYISMEYFIQQTIKDEIGSSAMPHKVNPIDFENAEGNLGMANAVLNHLANKLPISRLQRDLTDSTVLRNLGVPFAHILIAIQSINKGVSKLEVNTVKINQDLENHWIVLSEAIQTILRREGVDTPYEQLKALTRGNQHVDKNVLHKFITELHVSDDIKQELLKLTPHNYVGR